MTWVKPIYALLLCFLFLIPTVAAVPPIASIGINASSGPPPLAIQFYDQSEHFFTPNDTRNWAFGDGDTSLNATPVHVYTEYGFFDVGLKSANDDGEDYELIEKLIYVSNESIEDYLNLKCDIGVHWIRWVWESDAYGTAHIYIDGVLVDENTARSMYLLNDLNADEKHTLTIQKHNFTSREATLTAKTLPNSMLIYILILISVALTLTLTLIPPSYAVPILGVFGWAIDVYLLTQLIGREMLFYVIVGLMIVQGVLVINYIYTEYIDELTWW